MYALLRVAGSGWGQGSGPGSGSGAGAGALSARAALRCACAVALLAAALAADTDKRAESEFMSPMPFVLGSRYGRSQPRLIAPRNDRFFMGSRYGKRSDPHALLPPQSAPSGMGAPSGSGSGAGAGAHSLLCEYTGVYTLYRCSARQNSIDYIRRPEESRVSEEE